MTVRNLLKSLALSISWLLCKLFRIRQQPAILMYHSFDENGWRYGTSPFELKRQIKYLLANFSIVPLEDIVAFTEGKKEIPAKSVAITVDDGYRDTYEVLFPIAKEFNIPFTIFLTTDLSKRDFFGNLDRPTEEQLKEMSDCSLISIQLHGHSHKNFKEVVANNLIAEEITKSEIIIKDLTGKTPQFAAYPSGVYDESCIDMLKGRGYRAALATHSGFVRTGDDLFRLKRIEVGRRIPFYLFVLRLTPALKVYNGLVGALKFW